VNVVLTLVQTKQIRINIHKRNNAKHSKHKYTYYRNTHTIVKPPPPHKQSPTKITVIILTGENRTRLSKTCSSVTLHTTNLTRTDRGSNPVSCSENPSINCLGDGTVSSNTGVRTDFVRKPTYIPSFRNLTGHLLCLHYKEQPNELFRENNFVSSEIHTRLCGHRSTTGHSGEETRSRLYRGSKYVSSRQISSDTLLFAAQHDVPPAVAVQWTSGLATLRQNREMGHGADYG